MVILGETHKSFGESTDVLAAGTSPEGTIAWARTLGGASREHVTSVVRTVEGGYLLAATTRSLFYTPVPGEKPERPLIVKLSSTAVPEWSVLLEDAPDGRIGSLKCAQTPDGGFACAGAAQHGVQDPRLVFVVVKLDASGRAVWSYRYPVGRHGWANTIVALPGGDLVVAGGTSSDPSSPDAGVVLELSPEGVPVWARIFRAEGRRLAFLRVARTREGLVLSGMVDRGQGHAILGAALTENGAPFWSRVYEPTGAEVEALPFALAAPPTGGMVIAGAFGTRKRAIDEQGFRAVFLNVDPGGDLKRSTTVVGGDRNEEVAALQFLDDGRLCLGLNTENFGAIQGSILLAQWAPAAGPSSAPGPFRATGLDVKSSSLDLEREPLAYRHEDLPVKLLRVQALRVRSVGAPSR